MADLRGVHGMPRHWSVGHSFSRCRCLPISLGDVCIFRLRSCLPPPLRPGWAILGARLADMAPIIYYKSHYLATRPYTQVSCPIFVI